MLEDTPKTLRLTHVHSDADRFEDSIAKAMQQWEEVEEEVELIIVTTVGRIVVGEMFVGVRQGVGFVNALISACIFTTQMMMGMMTGVDPVCVRVVDGMPREVAEECVKQAVAGEMVREVRRVRIDVTNGELFWEREVIKGKKVDEQYRRGSKRKGSD